MIATLLGLLGFGGGLTFILGFLLRFAFMAPLAKALPGFAAVLAAFAELVLRLIAWLLTAAIEGTTHVCQRWQALLTVVLFMFAAGWYGDRYDPVRAHLPGWLQSRAPVASRPFKPKPVVKVAAKPAPKAKAKTPDRKPGLETICKLSGIC